MIKAIETVYNGYKFRSRLEARWAVFFDTLGIEYQYELEGFDLDGLWYLPDFYLPRVQMWAEVKPEVFNQDETKKVQLLAKYTERPVLMLVGLPEVKNYWAWCYSQDAGQYYTCDYMLSNYHGYYTSENRFYAATGLSEDETPNPGEWLYFSDMVDGVNAARQARFGQNGKG